MAGLLVASGTLADPLPRGAPTDHISVDPHEDVLELSWADSEERLRGSLRPASPRAGEPLHVSLEVGSFEGADFQGPLVLTLREAGATHGETLTVKRGKRHWEATFTPEHEGPYLLDVGFRTTHTKVVHAAFEVGPSLVPRLLGYGLLMGIALVLLLSVGRGILREQRPRSGPPEPSGSPAPTAPVAEASPPPAAGSVSGPPAAEPVPAPTAEPGSPPASTEPPAASPGGMMEGSTGVTTGGTTEAPSAPPADPASAPAPGEPPKL